MNTGWICPKCGTPVSPNEKTCPRCTVDGYVTVTVNANSAGITNNNKYCTTTTHTSENCEYSIEQMICS